MKKKVVLLSFISFVALASIGVSSEYTSPDGIVVSVPAKMTLEHGDSGYSASDYIKVSGAESDIFEYTVGVSLDNSNIEFINENDEVLSGMVSLDGSDTATWENADVIDGVSKSVSIEVTETPTESGTYSSQIIYNIEVNKKVIENTIFTTETDDTNMTVTITGLTDYGKTWVKTATNKKAAGELAIPEYLGVSGQVYEVTSIGYEAFNANTSITSVTMAESVEKLEFGAFKDCTNLVTCQLSDNISDWGSSTEDTGAQFYACSKLESINIPNGVSNIPYSCFCKCTSLKNIDFPHALDIGYQAFAYSGLTSVSLPEGTTFAGTCTELGRQFYYCTSLTDVNIPSATTIIPYEMFVHCESLKNVELPEGITAIGNSAFKYCTSLTTFDVPETCEKIYNIAFQNCTGLTEFSIPIDCDLTDMSGGDKYAQFQKCTNIKTVYITVGRTGVNIAGNYNRSGTNDARVPWNCGQANGSVDLIFEEGIIEIQSTTFDEANTLKSITLPSTITYVNAQAFNAARYVSSIYCNNSIMEGYRNAFSGVGQNVDTTLYLGDNVTLIPIAITKCTNTANDIPEGGKYINYVDWGNSKVTAIQDYQFTDCALYEISFPDTVETIGIKAFRDCDSLGSVNIPDSVKTIGSRAFYDCSALISISVGSGVTSIGEAAFTFCREVRDIYWDCINLETVHTFARYIFFETGYYAALYDDGLTFHFGDSWQENGITEVPKVFYDEWRSYTSMYRIEPFKVDWGTFKPTSLNWAFTGTYVKEVYVPETVTTISSSDFWACRNLTTIHLENTLEYIDASAFNATTLQLVYYNGTESERYANLTINETENSGILNATWIYLKEETPTYKLYNWNLDSTTGTAICTGISTYGSQQGITELDIPESFTKEGVVYTTVGFGEYAFANNSSITKVTIPSGVTTLANGVFENCSSLTSVSLPDGLTSMQGWVFKGSGITSIALPDSLESLGNECFRNCKGLTSVVLPNNLKSLGDYCFRADSNLTSVTFGSGLETIGSNAFDGAAITGVEASHTNLQSIGGYAFANNSNLTTVNLPDTAVFVGDAARTTGGYQFYNCTALQSLVIPSANTVIPGSLCDSCSSLSSVTIPEGITAIGKYALCVTSLTEIVIPDGVTEIEEGVFKLCTSLVSVSMPEGITSIGSNAFYGDTALVNINLPDAISNIGEYAFYQCKVAQITKLPSSLTTINQYTFYQCQAMSITEIPEGVTSIGTYAFWNDNKITSLILPSTLSSIGTYAFRYCYYLVDVTIPNTTLSISKYAFYNCDRLATVYYLGTEDEKNSMLFIASYNNSLTNAAWYYNEPAVALLDEDLDSVSDNNLASELYSEVIVPDAIVSEQIEGVVTEDEASDEELGEESSSESEENSIVTEEPEQSGTVSGGDAAFL